ncbi:MAG: histidine kinase [candidate division KSB1 bacterium]|nr:histidine kinase [candidate division KSB1 bacterium]MDZ7301698.1 histidine kinase [candidate division KSB1 bacterium]MDZ7312415.1 histidine kinase [candidate division KSB1 bacterium]
MRPFQIIVFFTSIISFRVSYSQTAALKFEHLSLEQGLSQIAVYSIIQDHKGFMWFGTRDGLNKYDGYNFTVYKNIPFDSTSLSDNWVRALHVDKSGALWVGTSNGLNKFDPKTERFTHYKHDPNNPHSLSDNRVLSILEDRMGTLWIGTDNGGLNKFDRKMERFVHYRHDLGNANSLSNDQVRVIYEDRAGELWVGTVTGLNKFNSATGTFTRYQHEDADPYLLSQNEILTIHEDRSGTLWFGTRGGGLNRFDRRTEKITRYQHDPRNLNSLSDDRVSAIWEDQSGMLWVGTLGGGLNKFEPKTERFFRYQNDPRDPSSLNHNAIWSVYEDRSGCLWIGTVGGGLNKLAPTRKKFNHYASLPHDANSLNNNFVLSLCEDHLGILWIGTYGGGLNKYDRRLGKFTIYQNDPNKPGSLSHNVVRCIYEDHEGRLWIGTRKGLNLFDRRTETFTHFKKDPNNPDGLLDDDIKAIYEDKAGTLWIGTISRGLSQLMASGSTKPSPKPLRRTNSLRAYSNREVDPRTVRFKTYQYLPGDPHSLSSNYVSVIFEDRSGTLWIGTNEGLNKFDQQTGIFKRFTHDPQNPNTLSHNMIRSIYEDQSGMLWIGTSQGLNKFDRQTETFASYFEKDGLPNEVIYGILGDDHGNLWLSTNKGLCKFNDRLPTGKKAQNFDLTDGLQSNEFSSGAYHRSQSGEMFFGGINGFNSFYPDEIGNNPFPPPVVLTAFRKFDKVVKLDTAIAEIQQLKLTHKDDFFAFEFAALDYTVPEKNRYDYKLEGFDKDWIEAGTRRYASYTHLNGGEYVFRIKAANNDGVWNEQGTAVKIFITPPYWQTTWFRILAPALIGALLLLVYHNRIARLKKEKMAQEAFSKKLIEFQENERKRIAGELHDSLGQDLLIINNGIRQCLNLVPDQSEIAGELRQLSEIALQSVNEVREISYDLHPHQLDRLGLKMAIESIIHKFSQSFSTKFFPEIDKIDGLFSKDMEIHVYRIVQEGMRNIVQHAGASESHIWVSRMNEYVKILITDNGKGFAAELQAPAASGRPGLGLTSIAERVKIMKGKFSIHSTPGQGTTLDIQIPLPQRS